MYWGAPEFLPALWIAPLIGAMLLLLWRKREQGMKRLFHDRMLAQWLPPQRVSRARWRLAFWIMAFTLGVVALARPQWGERWIEMQHKGMDILVVMDTSNSMRAQDILPSRLDRAKLGIRDFVQQLRGDRIGLIPFAGDSYLYCPLTSDYGAFLMMLDDLYPGIVPRGGTAIEQALRRAMESFDDQVSADRVIILVTDGEDHEGQPLQLIEEMRKRNIRIFAIGIGSPEGELIPVKDEQGRPTFLRDRQGNVVRSSLQEDVLERLSTRTGGMYVRATPLEFGLEKIYEERLSAMQRGVMDTRMLRAHEDRFAWFVGVAFLLWMAESFLRSGKNPAKDGSSQKIPLWILAALLSLPINVNADSARDLMRRGLGAYVAEDFETAIASFQEAGQRAPGEKLDAARAHFNRANALYAAGQHEAAAAAYQEALQSTDLTLQHAAHFNRGNALLGIANGLVESMSWNEALTATQKALESYRNALTLKSDDEDAKINHEWASRFKQQIEEIIEQMPPPPPQPEQGEDQQDSQDEQEQQQDQPEKDPGEDEQESSSSPPPQSGEQEGEPDARQDLEELSEDEINMILDAMKQEEQATRDQMRLPVGDPEAVLKDW